MSFQLRIAAVVTLLFAVAAFLPKKTSAQEIDFGKLDKFESFASGTLHVGAPPKTIVPVAKLVRGQPAEEIGNFARQIEADLIVVGHQRQSAFDRWWSGPKGAYLMDYTDCSLLVARDAVSDEAIEAAFMTSGQTNG